ncbi:O-acyltransferase WSD1-like [Cynara cardunculus var. scolymus]|uniref:O-acyltransferase WSD1-like n=1 Tax=Cynara cardunculus var. scolymus TaxID=59895 RepID=UPI000D62DB34|nr:O-acyltransferase WSD1-like [Cynara cardunculus var. scolymus]
MSHELDQPLTPAGRLFLQPETNIVVISSLGTKEPLRIEAIKSVIADSMLAKHPRLSSLLVVDKNGHEYWRKTEIDMDRHVIIRHDAIEGAKDDEDAANIYMADLAVSVPLETDKPLWELHLLTSHKCAVIRVHHALGDGVSFLSFLLAMCRQAADPTKMSVVAPPRGDRGKETIGGMVGRWLKVVWFTMVFVVDFIARVVWVCDETTVVSGGAGVELWPRKLVTARFLIDDMKMVKKSIPKTTINDVLFGVISFGLSKYLDARSSKSLHDGLRLTGLAMVNLRPQPGYQDLVKLMKNKSTGWGNKFGMLLLPTYCYRSGSDPLEYLRRAKTMIDQKKSSLESFFSYKFGYLIMSILGAKYASLLNYKIMCNTTFTISNMVGPTEKITFAGHPVDYIKTTSTSLPHAITMHMISYAGTGYMQILVAKDIVPDPDVLAKCLEDALLEMKEAAVAAIKSR